MAQTSSLRRALLSPALFCALALAVCVAAAHPVLEMGINDDWSYVWSARDLAQTGHIHYNGWTTAMLGWQLYLGALFIKIFGFSFTVVRVPVLLVAMGATALVQRLFVRLGSSEFNSTVATLTLTLSPLYLPLSFSFMSDVPGFACIVLCLYMCLRAMQSATDRAAVLWLVSAALVNALDGTVRQIAWLGVLVLVPSMAWALRRRRGALLAGGLSFAAGLLVLVATLHWFSLQPYALIEKTIALPTTHLERVELFRTYIRSVLATLLFLLPVLLAFAWRFPFHLRRARTQALAVAALIVAIGVPGLLHPRPILGYAPFSDNTIGPKGVMDIPGILGDRPEVIHAGMRIFLLLVILCALAALVLCCWHLRPRNTSAASSVVPSRLSRLQLFYLLGPFTGAYVLLLVTRVTIFDRYLLPLLLVSLILLLRLYEGRFGGRLPWVCSLAVGLVALLSVCLFHDDLSLGRARLAAADELRAAGVPRGEINAGVEYDAWTELELVGFVNDPRIRKPAGAYQPTPAPALPQECRTWFWEHLPAIHAQYALAYQPISCFKLSGFPAVSYTTWLPPYEHQVLIEDLR